MNRIILLFEVLLFSLGFSIPASTAANGQAQKPQTISVLLVDTDDTCRLMVDDKDEGVVTPAQSNRINLKAGQHVVKCVVDGIPDLVWRKIVETKGSDQVAALVTLKALHIKYDQAVEQTQALKQQAEEQKQKEEAAKAEAAAADEKRREDEVQFPQKFYDALKGTWRHAETDPGEADSGAPPCPSKVEITLEFQSLSGRTINVRRTEDRDNCNFAFHHRVHEIMITIGPADARQQDRCIESTLTYARGPKKGTRNVLPNLCSSQSQWRDAFKESYMLLDPNNLKVISYDGDPGKIFTR